MRDRLHAILSYTRAIPSTRKTAMNLAHTATPSDA